MQPGTSPWLRARGHSDNSPCPQVIGYQLGISNDCSENCFFLCFPSCSCSPGRFPTHPSQLRSPPLPYAAAPGEKNINLGSWHFVPGAAYVTPLRCQQGEGNRFPCAPDGNSRSCVIPAAAPLFRPAPSVCLLQLAPKYSWFL